MFNFSLSDFFAPVVNWVKDFAGAPVAAIGAQALRGAVYGTAIGAAQAVVSGGDIKKGALRGAAAGGVVAGTVSSLGQVFGGDKFSAENQLEGMGYSKPDPISQKWDYNSPDEITPDPTPRVNRKTGILNEGGKDDTAWWNKESNGGSVVAGILGGAATGAGNYMTAKEQAKSEKELFDKRAAHDKELLTMKNQMELDRFTPPSRDYQGMEIGYQLSDWWNKRMQERRLS